MPMQFFMRLFCLSLSILLGLGTGVFAQRGGYPDEITGTVIGPENEPLTGAYVLLEGTNAGTITDADGKFRLAVDLAAKPVIVISIIGYSTQRIPLSDSTRELKIQMEEKTIMSQEIVVSASRVEERLMETPVTIEKLTMQEIREAPAANAYEALGNLKGVDIMGSSLNFKVINTRGFNAPANARFVQRLDGVDMQTPGLNMPVGALSGATDLDIQSMELIPGASSALYGPNAFNGLLNVMTKNPFQFPGVSATVRMGFNHLDGVDHSPSPLYDFAFRVAQPLSNRFAIKINAAYSAGQDWQASAIDDMTNYAGTTNTVRGPGGAGYDGLNLYGDEVGTTVTEDFYRQPGDNPNLPPSIYNLNLFIQDSSKHIRIEPTRIARTGYRERDVTDYSTYSARGDASLHYRLTDNVEAVWTSRFSRGSSVLQADNRVRLQDFVYHNHKFEVTGKRFFVRTYATFEDAGNSYDTRFMGMNLNRAAKSDTNWFAQYNMAYFGILEGLDQLYSERGVDLLGEFTAPRAYDAAAARAFADGNNTGLMNHLLGLVEIRRDDPILQGFAPNVSLLGGGERLVPGTPEFNAARDRIARDPDWNTGARFIDRSRLYAAEAQYDLTDLIPWAEVIIGGNTRQFVLDSEGTIFADTAGVIRVSEVGGYIQATKRFVDDRVRVTASGRFDKTQRFDARFTPRVATTFTLGQYRQHNIRASYQTGFRMPDLRHQWVSFDVGPYRVIGGFDDFFEQNGLLMDKPGEGTVSNAYTLTSVQAFRESGDVADLQRANMREIRPEFVQSVEVGYKTFLTKQLMIDVSAYASRYRDFIGSMDFIGPSANRRATSDMEITTQDILTDSVQYFRRYVNSEQTISTFGIAGGFNYFLTKKLSINGNYTYAYLADEEGGGIAGQTSDGLMTEFNTPPHKVNVAFVGRNLHKSKRLGFAVNFRWQDEFLFQYGFGNGMVPSYHSLDAQVSYKMPKLKTIVRMGGSNILNQRRIEMFGGPTIGSMVYMQITYDGLLN